MKQLGTYDLIKLVIIKSGNKNSTNKDDPLFNLFVCVCGGGRYFLLPTALTYKQIKIRRVYPLLYDALSLRIVRERIYKSNFN